MFETQLNETIEEQLNQQQRLQASCEFNTSVVEKNSQIPNETTTTSNTELIKNDNTTKCIIVNDLIYYQSNLQTQPVSIQQSSSHQHSSILCLNSHIPSPNQDNSNVFSGMRFGLHGVSSTSAIGTSNDLVPVNETIVMSPSPQSNASALSPSSSLNSSLANKLNLFAATCLINENSNASNSAISVSISNVPSTPNTTSLIPGKYTPNKKPQKKKAQLASDLDEERTSQLVSEILKNIKEKTKELESMNQNLKGYLLISFFVC